MSAIRRREFIAGLGSAAAWPVVARAQQAEQVRRVGVLMNGAATEAIGQARVAGLVQELRQLGWTEGRNLRVDVRWNGGDAQLARIYAAQLIGLMPDLILASSTTNLTVIRRATSTIPVVFISVTDPVAQGFVASVTKPGGNITGFAFTEFSIAGKWLGLLKQIAPGVSRVGILFNPETSPQSKFYTSAAESAASSLDMHVVTLPVRATADIEPALENFASQPNGSLILPTDTFTRLRGQLIADLAIRYRLPTIGDSSDSTQGGLMSYGVTEANHTNQFRQAATYVDRILKGAKPGDLPVQSADRYTLIINRNTAKALGLTIPETLLATADEVIQ
jgi:putative tryptophan/tyrosine transport system substrate-binding protein